MHTIPGRIAIVAGIFRSLAGRSLYLIIFCKVDKEMTRIEILLDKYQA